MVIETESELSKKHITKNQNFLLSVLKGTKGIFVVWLISKESMHGYKILSILNDIASNLPGEKVVPTSTIYPILHSLEKDNLIVSHKELNGSHEVKVYNITDEGLLFLQNTKSFIKKNPGRDIIMSFFDDMFFNDEDFKSSEVDDTS
ncbi:MAG: PadR family transcriptional regulator [Methanosphaera sp.]|nr:PadR family transcriptional regulator [Methanosphaera sp.]